MLLATCMWQVLQTVLTPADASSTRESILQRTESHLLNSDRDSICFARGLQTLGLAGLGMSSGFERLHYLLESAFDADGDLSPAFLKASGES